MRTIHALWLYCKYGEHEKCKGFSKGTRSDPVNAVCTCECHTKKKPQAERRIVGHPSTRSALSQTPFSCEFCGSQLITRIRLRRVIKGYVKNRLWEKRT